jgi:hypothetical protein
MSSIAHLAILPVASQFWITSPRGKDETTITGETQSSDVVCAEPRLQHIVASGSMGNGSWSRIGPH